MLAEKYKVEPKLVRLLDEIVQSRLQGSDKPAEGQQAPAQEPEIPSTNIHQLDEHIDCLAYDAQTAAYVITELAFVDNNLGDLITKRLWSQIGKFTNYEILDQELIRKGEPETAADIAWWLSFWQGVKHGEKIT